MYCAIFEQRTAKNIFFKLLRCVRQRFQKYYICKEQIFQNISAYDSVFKKRRTLFMNITYTSNCTVQYGACKVYVWCKYSVYIVYVQCLCGARMVHWVICKEFQVRCKSFAVQYQFSKKLFKIELTTYVYKSFSTIIVIPQIIRRIIAFG